MRFDLQPTLNLHISSDTVHVGSCPYALLSRRRVDMPETWWFPWQVTGGDGRNALVGAATPPLRNY